MRGDGDNGRRAEDLAIDYLLHQGYRLVARNYRCARGEIDAVMLDGRTLAFVEVRCRAAGENCALESITSAKRRRLLLAARHFLSRNSYDLPCRFDVVVIASDPTSGSRIFHYPAAFDCGE